MAGRPIVLTNSAAEFLETQADETLSPALGGSDTPEFAAEIDRFVAKGNVPK